MNIDVKRLPSESKIISIQLYDKIENVTEYALYQILRVRVADNTQEVIATIDPNVESTEAVITRVAGNIIIEILDKPDLFGSKFLYRAWRVNDFGVDEDPTDFIEISTLPEKVSNFRMVDNQSTFDEIGIPKIINFQWDSYNTLTDNYDIVGFHLYYSIADRNKDNWTVWAKLRGDTTFNNDGYAINFINKDSTSVNVKVPQLSDQNNPKDFKFALVAVTGGTNPIQSRFSKIEIISLTNKMISVISASDGGTIILPENTESSDNQDIPVLTLPIKVVFSQNAFEQDATVMLERLPYDAEVANYDYRYTYELRTSKPISSFGIVSMYVPIPVDAKYEVRIEKNSIWTSIPCTYDTDLKKVSFVITEPCKFVLLIKSNSLVIAPTKTLESLFSEYTNKIIQRLPTWFKMRRNPSKSNGAYFLDVVGLEIEEMKFILDYAERQTHLSTADIDQADIIYKAKVSHELSTEYNVAITSQGFILEKTETLDEFLAPPYKNSDTPEVYYNNQCVVDYNDNVVYTKKTYNETEENPLGEITVSLFKQDSAVPFYSETIKLEIHHVWNFFDEFGLLLNTPRLYGEKNSKYKERLYDVFKNKSNSSRIGLMNGIARELGIRTNTIWKDNSKDLIIKDPMVIVNMIKIDGEIVPLDKVWFTSEDYIVIKAEPNIYPENAEVTYVSGLEMHTFNNKKDMAFQQQLYNINGTATKLFKHYVDTIKQRVPVEWGQFKWNEGYWDAGSPSVGGYGYLPSLMDANITGFRPILIDLITQPKPMSITIEERVQIQRYDKRSAL